MKNLYMLMATALLATAATAATPVRKTEIGRAHV